MPHKERDERTLAERRMESASENLKEMERLIGPYLKRRVPYVQLEPKKWESSDSTITKISLKTPAA
jgi:hypothetical protein